jgi:hypothetical protein
MMQGGFDEALRRATGDKFAVFEPRYRLARCTLRAAIREQLDRSLPLVPRDLETATDEMLLRLTAPSLANVLQIVAGAHGEGA